MRKCIRSRGYYFGLPSLILFFLLSCTPPLRQAEEQIEKGNFAKAEPILEKILAQEPENPDANALLAQAYFYTHPLSESLPLLHQLKQNHNASHHSKRIFKEISETFATLDQQLNSTDADGLENYLGQVAPNSFFKSRVQWHLFQILKKNGKLQAAEALKQTLQQSASDPLIRQLLDWEEARQNLSLYPELLATHEKSTLRPYWYWQMIKAHFEKKELREANQLLVEFKKEAQDENLRAEILLKQAEANLGDNPIAALNYYRTFLKNHPKHPEGRAIIYKIREELAPHISAEDRRFLAEAAHERWMFQTAYTDLSQQTYNHPADLYKLGQYALDGNFQSQAQVVFSQLMSRHPGTLEAGKAQVALASIERNNRQYSAALSRLNNVKTAYGSSAEVVAAALWEEGKVYDHLNQADKRADICQRLLQLKPDAENAPAALWHVIWQQYLQKNYQNVVQSLEKYQTTFKDDKLASRLKYWHARAYEHLEKWEQAIPIYKELSKGYLLDYYTHRARERLRVIETGGEDRYAVGNFHGYHKEVTKLPGYHAWFQKIISAPQLPTNYLPEVEELLYLKALPEFMDLARYSDNEMYIIWRALLLQQEGNYYDLVTQYRWPAETNNTYLPAAFPLAFFENIEREAAKYKMNPFLVSGLIWQESQYKPDIKSWVGATGLMQIMPATGADIAANLGLKNYQLTDAATNIQMGTWYLNSRHQEFDGNSLFAVASYNAGAGPVYRWKKEFGHLPLDALAESITYPETQEYVKKVFTAYWIYEYLYGKK